MTITITNHGTWNIYVPSQLPEEAPRGALFAKRVSDGIDWYDYIYKSGTVFSPGSIKATVLNGVILAATRDETLLFPQGFSIIEITGDDTTDPQASYGKQLYDETTNAITPPSPQVPKSITRRQLILILHQLGYITDDEAIAASQSGAIPAFISGYFNSLTGAQKVSAIVTWSSMSECDRSDPMLAALAAANNLTSAQLDGFFITASQL